MKELDLIVGSWAVHNAPQMSRDELLKFNKEVLQHETPELLKKLLGSQQIGE
jgi:succinate dehydrogenase flavin-adding protein (antitoxin of CptAB toxin-antitoxin module)